MQIYQNKRKYFHKKRSTTPRGLVWDTKMAAVSLFWDPNMAAVTSCENALLLNSWVPTPSPRIQIFVKTEIFFFPFYRFSVLKRCFRSPKTPVSRFHVDGGKWRFSKTMMSYITLFTPCKDGSAIVFSLF